MTARAGADLDGKLWTDEANAVLAKIRLFGEEEKEPEQPKKEKRLASGWDYFRLRKEG